jgi:hypothetical protein
MLTFFNRENSDFIHGKNLVVFADGQLEHDAGTGCEVKGWLRGCERHQVKHGDACTLILPAGDEFDVKIGKCDKDEVRFTAKRRMTNQH